MKLNSTIPALRKGQLRFPALLCAAALATASLFTGCKKEYFHGNEVSTTGNKYIPTPPPAPNTAAVDYRLVTVPPEESDLVQWNAGFISTTDIKFSAVRTLGSALGLFNYTTATDQSAQLFATGNLGTIAVPYSLYKPINFKISLKPLLTSESIVVSGYYFINIAENNVYEGRARLSNIAKVPVRFVVEEPAELDVALPDGYLIDQNEYLSVLSFVPSAIAAGIDKGMLDNAERIGGTVLISRSSNVAIYNIMLANLNNALSVQFMAKEVNNNIQ